MSTGYLLIYHLVVPVFTEIFALKFIEEIFLVVVGIPDGHRLEGHSSEYGSGQMNTLLSSFMTALSISHLIASGAGVSVCLWARYHPDVTPSSTARDTIR